MSSFARICMHIVCLNFLLFSTLSFAENNLNINSKHDLCVAIGEQGFFQRKLLTDADSLLAFRNLPGPLNRGVCWWHSRFTRAATYLAVFRPDIPQKPSPEEVVRILGHIRRRDKVVEITGYRNLREFSDDQRPLIEEELNRWSIIDSFNFTLIHGLHGSSKENPKTLEQMMDHLFYLVTFEGRIVFETLQLPGLSAHSWLVVGMTRKNDGYELSVIDSNYLSVQKWNYRRGQSQFWYKFTEFLPIVGPFVPYANKTWRDEENEIIDVVKRYCRN